MNKTEHLLTILIEECAEVQQRATKALRFGLKDIELGQIESNVQKLEREVSDLLCAVNMLEEHEKIELRSAVHAAEKHVRVLVFLEYSRAHGTFIPCGEECASCEEERARLNKRQRRLY